MSKSSQLLRSKNEIYKISYNEQNYLQTDAFSQA